MRAAASSARMRLSAQPGEVIDRTDAFEFSWNGRAVPAYRGDTIASTLAASGERVLSRSFKYHRPRGLMSASYLDPGCLVQVDEEPNVRGAHRRVEPSAAVRAQRGWPSLRFDVRAASQWLSPFLSAGFYYKTFMKPRLLWPTYAKLLRRMGNAGGPVSQERPRACFDKRYAHPDVLVAGAGPAGMAAALAAAEAGARVMLVEEEYELGGHLRWGGAAELATLRELREAVAASPAIEALVDSVVTGRHDANWIAVVQRNLDAVEERLIKARAKMLVVAPGLIERPYVFEGNDKPGVMLASAVRRLINLFAVKPGERAVVLSANAEGDAAAADLERVGVEVARVVDARRDGDVLRARGRGGVREVELDDGVTGRLGAEHYLMTTTSSGAGGIWESVEQWLQTEHPDWKVHVTPVTTVYASINVAGPKSRELMSRLVEGVDLAPDAFPYMRVRSGRIAGVDDCFMWRIGFTGELSYEIHVPAACGVGDEFVSVIDLTRGRALLRLTGEDTAGLLAKVCAIDLDDRTTPEEMIEQENKRIAIGRWAVGEDIANVICFLASPLNTYMVGQALAVEGGKEFMGEDPP